MVRKARPKAVKPAAGQGERPAPTRRCGSGRGLSTLRSADAPISRSGTHQVARHPHWG